MDDFKLDVYSVGEKYDEFKKQEELTIQLHYRDNYWEMLVALHGITREEVKNLQYGNLQFALTVIDDCLFLLMKAGQFEWMDFPFEPRLHHRKFEFYDFAQGEGAPLHMFIADGKTGKLMAMRAVGLGNSISNALSQKCRELQEKPFDEMLYRQKVDKIYRKYPSSAAMLKTVKSSDIFMLLK